LTAIGGRTYNSKRFAPIAGEAQTQPITQCQERPMRKDLMEILACPMCKGDLQLTVEEERDDEVVTGSLFCATCNERYPIEDSIPNLLPPELRTASAG